MRIRKKGERERRAPAADPFGFVNTGRKVFGMAGTLAVDPGANGGVAWCCHDSWLWSAPMPSTPRAFRDMVRAKGPSKALVEDIPAVGAKMQGVKDGPAYRAFGAMKTVGVQMHQAGWIEGVLVCLDVEQVLVPPKEWQKAFGTLPRDYGLRKWAVKQMVSRELQRGATGRTADALGILLWASGWKSKPVGRAEDLI